MVDKNQGLKQSYLEIENLMNKWKYNILSTNFDKKKIWALFLPIKIRSLKNRAYHLLNHGAVQTSSDKSVSVSTKVK